jgi:hypothetical protein
MSNSPKLMTETQETAILNLAQVVTECRGASSEQAERIKENLLEFDWATCDMEALEECFEDRDPLEFL